MVETTRTPVFSRYEVLEKIGSGGMGTVYKARDTHLDRWVALKVLPPGIQEDVESLERFKREARALARLKHAGVAAVYDAHVEGGFPHMVMEFIEGANLEQALRAQGAMPIDAVVRLGIEQAEALDYIHRRHVIHRDVKTSNIILSTDGRAVLADFGIAFFASLPRISQGAIGTPEYMSPEQADGKPLDGRADLYSLGVVLYECLTGTVPFRREEDSLAALSVLMRQILERPAPSLTERSPEVPEWLAEVVMRCLAKRAEDRFANGAELAMALRMGGATRVTPSERPAITDPALADDPPVNPAGARKGILLISHVQPVDAVAFSPDSRRLASASEDRVVRLWRVADGKLLHALDGHTGNVQTVAFSPNGPHLASGDADGTVRIWDAGAGLLLHAVEAHTAFTMSVTFEPDGRHVISGGADGAVRMWDVRRGRLKRTLGWHQGYVLAVAASPDGGRLASGGADGTVRIWDVRKVRQPRMLEEHSAWVTAVAFSPEGRYLASGGSDGAVVIWEARDGKLLHRLAAHRSGVMSLAFSPDGKHIVSAGRDQAVRLWEVAPGREVRCFEGHTGPVTGVAFSPDGRHLASGSSDRTVRLWHLTRRDFRRRLSLRRLGTWTFLLVLALAVLYWAPPAAEVTVEAPRAPAEARVFNPFATQEQEAPEPSPAEAVEAPPPAPRHPLFGPEALFRELGGWTLVVGVRQRPETAQRFAEQLRQRGFRVSVLAERSAGALQYRISVGQFERRTEAVKARRRYAGGVLPYNTWIMRIRPAGR